MVFVHGLGSSPRTWTKLIELVRGDAALRGLRVEAFGYPTGLFTRRPRFLTTRIPEIEDLAQTLDSHLRAGSDRDLVLVAHSQGGLIVQAYLARMLINGDGADLARIRLVVLLACPNGGSEYLATMRRLLGVSRSPQTRNLEVLDRQITDTRRIVLRQVVFATAVTDRTCPIPFRVYAGDRDNVVTVASAQSAFPDVGILPGNHRSILDPDATGNLTFPTLRRLMRAALDEVRPTRRQESGTLRSPGKLFTGRTAEMSHVTSVVESATDPRDLAEIFVFQGMPGIGKTALATVLADRLTTTLCQRLNDPPLARHIDLRGSEGFRPIEPAAELSDQLLNLGIEPRDLPTTLNGLQDRWRTELAGRFVVLVLDNALAEEHVVPFLPGGRGYVLLVTSRRPLLQAVGATVHELGGLSIEESRELIASAARRPGTDATREAIDAIATLCGRHPQAMLLAVAGLASKDHLSFEDRLRALEKAPDRLTAIDSYAGGGSRSVARSFEVAYGDLQPDQRLLLRRLGLSPVKQISVEVATALGGLGAATAGHLQRLEAESLIQQTDAERYELHDLVRHYARHLAKDDDAAQCDAAVERALAYYARSAIAVDPKLTRQQLPLAFPMSPGASHPFTDLRSMVEWAHREMPHLLECADFVEQRAAKPGGPDDKRWLIWFASALAGLLRNEGLWLRSLQLQERAESAAEDLHSTLAQASLLHEQGVLHRLLSSLGSAHASLTKAFALFGEVDDDVGALGRAHVLNTCSVVLDQQRDKKDRGRRMLALALSCYRRLGDRLGEANALHDQGMTCWFTGKFAEASVLFEAALDLYREVDHPLGQAHALSNLARSQRRAGLPGEAARTLELAREAYRRLSNKLGEALSLVELGAVLRPSVGNPTTELTDAGRALSLLLEAETACRAIGSQIGLAGALKELGALFGATGDPVRAEELLRESLRLYRHYGITRDEEGVRSELGLLGLAG